MKTLEPIGVRVDALMAALSRSPEGVTLHGLVLAGKVEVSTLEYALANSLVEARVEEVPNAGVSTLRFYLRRMRHDLC